MDPNVAVAFKAKLREAFDLYDLDKQGATGRGIRVGVWARRVSGKREVAGAPLIGLTDLPKTKQNTPITPTHLPWLGVSGSSSDSWWTTSTWWPR